MDMICLNIQSACRPSVRFTDAADFLVEKRRQFANENLLAVFGTPDKVIGQFVGDVFGVLCIHTRHGNRCSNSCEASGWAALPLLER
jgi:hypothetical protein